MNCLTCHFCTSACKQDLFYTLLSVWNAKLPTICEILLSSAQDSIPDFTHFMQQAIISNVLIMNVIHTLSAVPQSANTSGHARMHNKANQKSTSGHGVVNNKTNQCDMKCVLQKYFQQFGPLSDIYITQLITCKIKWTSFTSFANYAIVSRRL